MTTQFIHIDGFPQVSRGAPHRSSRGMIAELSREAHASQHIKFEHACGARLIFGDDPYELLKLAEKQAADAVDRRGFKIKKTSNILFVAVASFPLTRVERQADDGWFERYTAFSDRVVAWAQRRWQGLRLSIVEHVDEDKIHLHIVVVPPLLASGQLNTAAVHPGFGAVSKVLDRQVREFKLSEATPREIKARQRRAYCHAMREFQNDFHRHVGHASGQARLSNSPRSRVTREQALVAQAQRQRNHDLNLLERDLVIDRFQMNSSEAALAEAEARIARQAAEVSAQLNALKAERQRLAVLANKIIQSIGQCETMAKPSSMMDEALTRPNMPISYQRVASQDTSRTNLTSMIIPQLTPDDAIVWEEMPRPANKIDGEAQHQRPKPKLNVFEPVEIETAANDDDDHVGGPRMTA